MGKVVGAAVGLDVVMVFDVPVTLTLTPLAWSAAGNDQRCDGQGGKKPRKTPCALIKYEQNEMLASILTQGCDGPTARLR